jgi:hypothetical protein
MSPAEEIAFLKRRLEESETTSETRRIALTLIGITEDEAVEAARVVGRFVRFAGRGGAGIQLSLSMATGTP